MFWVFRSTRKKGVISEKKTIPKSTFDATKGTMQPSQKWKSLGLTDEKFYTAPTSPLKTASRYVATSPSSPSFFPHSTDHYTDEIKH